MSQTDQTGVARETEAFFDTVICSLARGRKMHSPTSDQAFRDETTASYFVPYEADEGWGLQSYGDGSANDLLDALERLWREEGRTGLAVAVPELKALAGRLSELQEAETGRVNPLCYTLF